MSKTSFEIDKKQTDESKVDSIFMSKSSEHVRVVSYNVCVDFFDSKDKTDDARHHWQNRAPIVKSFISSLAPDILCLQELSPSQAADLSNYFSSTHKSFFLSQTPSEVPVGEIVSGDEVHNWLGKNIGTFLLGIFVRDSMAINDSGRFWLNENPDDIPTNTDRGETDKGFGNMNTYRAVFWVKAEFDADSSLYVFNSHYPLSGGGQTREQCANLEMEKIQKIAGYNSWISCGDRNLLPKAGDDCPKTAYEALTKYGDDITKTSKLHLGLTETTWLGFSYDKFRNILIESDDKVQFQEHSHLDVLISNIKPALSFILHGAYNSDSKLLPQEDYPALSLNESRNFASDHALIGADLPLDEFHNT